MIKVVTSCCGRFHIFDQAAQLENLGYLYRLIHSDPKFLSKRWGLPNSKVISFLLVGILARLLRHIPENMRKFYTPYVHIYFGKKLSKAIPKDSSVFIGLSSFSLEAIDKCKGLGILTIVDHGSLHPEYERDLIADEEKILGLQPGRFIASEKLINKQRSAPGQSFCEFLRRRFKQFLQKGGFGFAISYYILWVYYPKKRIALLVTSISRA